jgi:hypothetical protein
MKKTIFKHMISALAVAGFIFIAFGSGEDASKTNSDDSESSDLASKKYENYDLTKIKKGNILTFQNQCKGGCDKIVLEFIDSNKAKLKLNHVWDKTVGGSTVQMSENYEGVFDYSFKDTKNFKLTYDYWTLFNKGILLSNDEYGYDKGYLHLDKRYLISNIKDSKDPNVKMSPNIYSWLDPINYPARDQEFDGGIILNEIK